MIQFILLELLTVAWIAWRWHVDRFAQLDRFADDLERKLPALLSWKRGGAPISWVQHAVWVTLAGLVGGVLAWFLGMPFALGFAHFSTLAAIGFYVPREVAQAREHYRVEGLGMGIWVGPQPPYVGWIWDGIGDTLAAVLVAILGLRWWLS